MLPVLGVLGTTASQASSEAKMSLLYPIYCIEIVSQLPKEPEAPGVNLPILLNSHCVRHPIRKGLVNGRLVHVQQLGLHVDRRDLLVDPPHYFCVAVHALDSQLLENVCRDSRVASFGPEASGRRGVDRCLRLGLCLTVGIQRLCLIYQPLLLRLKFLQQLLNIF